MRKVEGPSGPFISFYRGDQEIEPKARQAAIDRRQGVDYLNTPFELTIHIQRFRDSPNRNHTGLQIAVGYWAYYLRQALDAYPEPVRCEICPLGGSSNHLLFGMAALKAHLIDRHRLKYRECAEAVHKDYYGKKGTHFPPEQIKAGLGKSRRVYERLNECWQGSAISGRSEQGKAEAQGDRRGGGRHMGATVWRNRVAQQSGAAEWRNSVAQQSGATMAQQSGVTVSQQSGAA